jgi:hypothetical protein
MTGMNAFLSTLLALTLVAVSVVLFMGIGAMSKGGEFNRKHSNRLMRWRVGLQAFAVLVIIAIFFVNQA